MKIEKKEREGLTAGSNDKLVRLNINIDWIFYFVFYFVFCFVFYFGDVLK